MAHLLFIKGSFFSSSSSSASHPFSREGSYSVFPPSPFFSFFLLVVAQPHRIAPVDAKDVDHHFLRQRKKSIFRSTLWQSDAHREREMLGKRTSPTLNKRRELSNNKRKEHLDWTLDIRFLSPSMSSPYVLHSFCWQCYWVHLEGFPRRLAATARHTRE